MDQGYGQRRRRAKAVAISQTVEAARKAVMLRFAVAVAGAAVAVEAGVLIGKLWASHS